MKFLHGQGDIGIKNVKRQTAKLIETHGRQHAPAIQAELAGMNTYYEGTPKGDSNRLTVLPKHGEALENARTALYRLEEWERQHNAKQNETR